MGLVTNDNDVSENNISSLYFATIQSALQPFFFVLKYWHVVLWMRLKHGTVSSSQRSIRT